MKKILLGVCFILCFLPLAAFSPAEKECVRLPVLMYHSVTSYGKSEYIIDEKTFENDLKFLIDNGYETVSVKQLYEYVDGIGNLPKKPIFLTFDDGHFNNLSAVLPLLEKYDCHAEINVIGKFCAYASEHPKESRHPEYSYLTWDDIKVLSKSGRFDIGSHTYNMHDYSPRFGIGRIKGENDLRYVEVLTADLNRLQEKLNACGVECTVFAYPFGRYNTLAQNTLVSMGYRMTLTCFEGVNIIEKGNPNSLIHLKRYNRASSLSTNSIFSLLAS